MLSHVSSQSLVEPLLPAHKVTLLDMHEEMRLRTEQRERVAAERNYTKLRRQQTGRGLTIALATLDGDEAINCAVLISSSGVARAMVRPRPVCWRRNSV